MSNWTQGTGCPTEFLKGIEALTREFNNKEIHNSRLTNQIEKLLNESKEKNKTIEKQRKHIEALKQKGNRYIEVNEKDRIIIYDTKENKFSWRTCWSDLPSNIIDDLYKNELINYYKHNVLKVVRRGELTSKANWCEREFYSTHNRNIYGINTEFSITLLKQIQNVRGEIRNIANKNYIRTDKDDVGKKEFVYDMGTGYKCIAICKNGNKCKCKGYDSLYDSRDNPNEYNYLYNIKNWSSMFLCSRHASSGSGDDKRFWLRKHLNKSKKVHKQDYNEFSIEERSNLFQNNERNDFSNSWIQ